MYEPNTILIVEDNLEDQVLYKRYLDATFTGAIEIKIFEEGRDALEYLEKSAVDCILLDYNLPDMSGLEFLEILKNSSSELTPVIMLSGEGNEEVAVESLKLGAYDYINKGSLKPEVLYNTIANAIDKSKLRKEIRNKDERIKHMAYHDYLTGVPNRLHFEKIATRAISSAKQQNYHLAIFIIDLDSFKKINDTYGHKAGDILLRQVVKRFNKLLRETDTLARFGGDEFVLLSENVSNLESAGVIAQKLIDSLEKPFLVDLHQLSIRASIGIAYFPNAGSTLPMLLRNADKALYYAKVSGKNTHRYFTSNLDKQSGRRIQLESALHTALEKNEFYLLYQPIINLDENKLYGVEALLRCNSSEMGELAPDEIIPIAEETGLIIQLGDWIIESIFQQYHAWSKEYNPMFKVSINLSPHQLRSQDWLAEIQSAGNRNKVDPQKIIFELTETDVISDLEKTGEQLLELTSLGCMVFIDDFGTGFSSINLIRHLPISGLKIDKSFVQDVTTDKGDALLVGSIIALAGSLNLMVVSEGIENEEQLKFIASHPGQKGQGYYLEKPISADEILKLVFRGKG